MSVDPSPSRLPSSSAPDLRGEAEKKLARAPPAEVSVRSEKELLHELQVHQIELEMQNETLRQAQMALEESRDRYADLYDFAPVGYLTLTDAGLISEINLTGAGLLGEERAKLVRRRFASFVLSKDQDRWHRHFMHAVKHGGTQTCELTLTCPDGATFDANLDCLRSTDDQAMPTLRITLTNIAERKQLAAALYQSQQNLAEAQKMARMGSWERDLISAELQWSEEMFAVFGVDCQTFRPSYESFLGTVHPEDREVVHRWASTIPSDQAPNEIEYRILRHSDGQVRWVHSQRKYLWDQNGRAVRVVGIVEDITERKVLELSLKRANAELQQFAFLVSHDLRNPLMAMSLALGAIRKRLGSNLTGEIESRLDMGNRAVERMGHLISDIMLYSRTGISVEKEPVRLEEAVADALFNLAAETDGAYIEIIDDLPTVLGNSTELMSLFQNLIGNAIKYRSPTSRSYS